MKAGVISDTHCRWFTHLPIEIVNSFKGVDIIFHAGDIVDLSYLRALSDLAPVEAVAGNNDTAVTSDILGYQNTIKFANKKIGLTHGHLGKGRTTVDRARNSFNDVDIIIFGHSHVPFFEKVNGVYLLNPGSVSRPRNKPSRASVAILEILGDKITSKLIYL